MILFDLVGVAFIGLVSAVLMTLFEFPFWKKWGMEGTADWQVNSVMVSKLLGRPKGPNQPRLSWTIASHLSHGVVAGIAFWLLFPVFFTLIPVANVLILFETIVYGIVLWFLFLVLGRRTFESLGGVRITRRGLWGSLLSLIVYGFFLGLLLLVTFH